MNPVKAAGASQALWTMEDIAAKIAYLMGDVNARRRMRVQGREHAQKFRWSEAATELLRVLRKLG